MLALAKGYPSIGNRVSIYWRPLGLCVALPEHLIDHYVRQDAVLDSLLVWASRTLLNLNYAEDGSFSIALCAESHWQQSSVSTVLSLPWIKLTFLEVKNISLSPAALICIIIYTIPTDELRSGRIHVFISFYVFVFSSIHRPVLAGKHQLDYLAVLHLGLSVSIRI